MLSLNQSDWTTTGELIHNRDQWPVPRNLIDRPLDEKKRHGINVAATIAKLRLDRVSGSCGGGGGDDHVCCVVADNSVNASLTLYY
jgi:hypothetical protein